MSVEDKPNQTKVAAITMSRDEVVSKHYTKRWPNVDGHVFFFNFSFYDESNSGDSPYMLMPTLQVALPGPCWWGEYYL